MNICIQAMFISKDDLNSCSISFHFDSEEQNLAKSAVCLSEWHSLNNCSIFLIKYPPSAFTTSTLSEQPEQIKSLEMFFFITYLNAVPCDKHLLHHGAMFFFQFHYLNPDYKYFASVKYIVAFKSCVMWLKHNSFKLLYIF